jgi:LPXTG-motif cell wall-anchored protein
MDTKGGLYILFSLRLGKTTPTHLYLMTSTTHGKSWSAPHQVDSNGLGSNVFPAITAGDPGRVAMTWYGTKSDDFNTTTAQWSQMYAESVNALSAHPTIVQSRVTSADTPVHAADICQAGTLCAVTGGNRNLADYQSVTTDPCGFAVMVYTDDHAPQAHTVVSRQTAGNRLYTKSMPSTCVEQASRVPHIVRPVASPNLATTGGRSEYGWLALGLVFLAGAGAFVWRRRLHVA